MSDGNTVVVFTRTFNPLYHTGVVPFSRIEVPRTTARVVLVRTLHCAHRRAAVVPGFKGCAPAFDQCPSRRTYFWMPAQNQRTQTA